jgi:GNAT superfamily N-acetyltransferase
MSEIRIWKLGAEDVPAAAALMTRAFQGDTFFCTSIPDDYVRRVHLPPFFEACLRYGVRYGHVYGAGRSDGVPEGVAWWYRFPDAHYDHERTMAVGFDKVDLLLGEGSRQIETISRGIDAEMERTFPKSRLNLDQIGVDPSSQGNGIGTALVERILADARRLELPVALWTDAQSSVDFYARLGFDVKLSGSKPEYAISWWALLHPYGQGPTLAD